MGRPGLAWAGTRTFCPLNGHDLTYESVDAAEAFVVAVAAGELDGVPEIAECIRARLIDQPT